MKKKQNRDAKSVQICLRLTQEMHDDLATLAEADRRTFTNYIRTVLAQHVFAVRAGIGKL